VKVLCVIPARLNSTRLARKALIPINGKPMVRMTYEGASQCLDIEKVIVATDSEEIAAVICDCGGKVEMTDSALKTGSDRVAAVAKLYPEMDVIVNLQGDEPFIRPQMLSSLLKPFYTDEKVVVATLGYPLDFQKDFNNPGAVKVICDSNGDAIYFSRSPIPYFRQSGVDVPVLHHMGVYAFRRNFLLKYTTLPQTPLELTESLEQLRILEHGYKIRVSRVSERTIEINTEDDLKKAREFTATGF
jgi:3-deoxy-manno-octulosonate cytidylyltransferase (CMP-KDO synthetase)